MPRIPAYQPGQVGPVQTTGARLRAVDDNGGAMGGLGEGLKGLGDATQRYAIAQDQINAQQDDLTARGLANEAMSELDTLTQSYQSLAGANAREAKEKVVADIKATRNRLIGQARNGRVRAVLGQHLDAALQSSISLINQHAAKEAKVEHLAAFQGQQDAWRSKALAEPDPIKRMEALSMGVRSIEDQMDFMGIMDPSARNLGVKRYTSAFHRDVIDEELAKVDPDAEMAFAYFSANKDEMVADDREAVMRDLQRPMQRRQAREDVSTILSDLAPVAGAGSLTPKGPGWTGVATGVASRFGLSAEEVAAVMSYETAGTFSPTIMGGKNKGYMGLIQFGKEERERFLKPLLNGRSYDQATPDNWTQAIGDFLDSRGFKRGMGILDLYSTINAGKPGKYGASDGNGTVRSHVDKIKRDHLPKARQWLAGQGASAEASKWDLQEVYRRIDRAAAEHDWSPERRDLALSEAEKAVGEREQLFTRAKDQATDAAIRRVVALGDDRFTSITALPHELRDELRRYAPEEYGRLEKLAEQNRDKKNVIPTNGPRKVELEMMKRVEPDGFLKVDLKQEIGRMPLSEINALMIEQAGMIGKQRQDSVSDLRPGIVRAIEWGSKYGGLEIPKEQFPRVFDHMQSVLRSRAQKGGLTAKDYDDAFKLATAPVKTNTSFLGIPTGSGSRRASELRLDNITDAAKEEARRNFRLANGRDPNDQELLAVSRRILTGE